MRRIVTLAVVLGSLSSGHCAKKPSAPHTAVPPTPYLEMVYMEPDRMEKVGEQRFAIYCYAGQNHTWKDTFLTVNVNVDCMGKKCSVYIAKQAEEILRHWKREFGLLPFTRPNRSFKIDPFNPSCVGIDAATPYSIELVVYQVHMVRLASFIIGNFILSYGHQVFMHLFCLMAYLAILAFIVICNYTLVKWITMNGDNSDHYANNPYIHWLFYVTLYQMEKKLFKLFSPRVVDILIRMLARLILLAVGNSLVNWGVNSHGPTLFTLAVLRAMCDEIGT